VETKTAASRSLNRICRNLLALCCAALLVPFEGVILAQAAAPSTPAPTAPASPAPADTTAKAAEKIPPEQLESLVAPIALYPDELLAQVLVASTYPLELVQLQQWMAKHPSLKDKALADSIAKQPWDSSVQTMAAVPDVVKRLADDVQWTTDLGNAFLAQQADVMDAIQRMRQKAKDKGALESNEQQKVETKVVEEKTVIIVESANPEVIYVPSYSPTVVYGYPYYPYPPIYYPPPPPPGAAFVAFSFGVAMGAAYWGGSCCHCGWGGNNVYINVNNNYNQINHNGGGNWSHNPQHRGGTPYGNSATQNKYGGASRGASGAGGASANTANRGGAGGASASTANRGGAGGASASTANRGGTGGASASTANRGGTGGSSQVGSRNVPSSSGSRSSGGFSGGSSGYSGSSARSSSSRGSSSMGSRGGGGGSRGGGGRR